MADAGRGGAGRRGDLCRRQLSRRRQRVGRHQLPIYCVQRDQKVCSISFDAAWGADNTQKILDVLKEYGVTCTFFVVGNWADQYPEQAKAIVDSGNELMNHSNAHDHYNSLTADQIIRREHLQR